LVASLLQVTREDVVLNLPKELISWAEWSIVGALFKVHILAVVDHFDEIILLEFVYLELDACGIWDALELVVGVELVEPVCDVGVVSRIDFELQCIFAARHYLVDVGHWTS